MKSRGLPVQAEQPGVPEVARFLEEDFRISGTALLGLAERVPENICCLSR